MEKTKVTFLEKVAGSLILLIVLSLVVKGCSKDALKRLKEQYETTDEPVYGTIAEPDSEETAKTSTTSATDSDYEEEVSKLAYTDYDGKDVISVNSNLTLFTDDEIVTYSYVTHAPLDEYGRSGPSIACLSKSSMPTEERDFDLSEVTPSGFKNHCYPELIEEDGWLYHRCHIIGYQLAGDAVDTLNLFTGTRNLNENGMLWNENEVADYLRKHPDTHVMYRVTPIYREDELVARGVLMEAYSVEDNGALEFCLYVYNVQDGIEIDYRTGDSKEIGE